MFDKILSLGSGLKGGGKDEKRDEIQKSIGVFTAIRLAKKTIQEALAYNRVPV